MYIYIIIIVIVALGIVGLFLSITFNKFQFLIIKMEEANNNIDILLEKKEKLLERVIPFIHKVNKEEAKTMKNNLKHKVIKSERGDLNNRLNKVEHELNKVVDANQKLTKDDGFTDLQFDLFNTNEELEAALKFYNDSVSNYNSLIKCFPTSIAGLVFRYKQKYFYTINELIEFEILKDKNAND